MWKDVCHAENDNIRKDTDHIAKVAMWQAFKDLWPYISGLVLTTIQQSYFKEKWGRAFVNAFGKNIFFIIW